MHTRNLYLVIALGLIVPAIIVGSYNLLQAKTDGAPSGNTGSPGDDQTCAHTSCHTGTANAREGLITTTVPVTGYLAGETYLITVTITEPGITKFGFQASAQNFDGDAMGEILVINDIETKETGGGKYITHKSTGTAGVDTRSWVFNWTPEESSGDVGFYVAVNASNDSGNATGDRIFFDEVILIEDPDNIPLSLHEQIALDCTITQISTDLLVIDYQTNDNSPLLANIVDMQGRIVKTGSQSSEGGHMEISTASLAPGCYIVVAEQGKARSVKQIVVY
jgi:hypothetical protein